MTTITIIPQDRRDMTGNWPDPSGERGRWRRLLVWHREHAGRMFVRVHAWNLHNTLHRWYPTKRSYSIPIESAADLAHALLQSAVGHTGRKPRWLIAREAVEDFVDHPEGWEPNESAS